MSLAFKLAITFGIVFLLSLRLNHEERTCGPMWRDSSSETVSLWLVRIFGAATIVCILTGVWR